ncbi:hypothetical protein KIW84_070489 [Lathyrus oleraceus]|uniref:Uncharacterized protein n=1 Tax=Pisum sativum TaxID=3888 RepID=A0A9D4VGX7_PEA|nr:hypothetical protein KIW84_070489 [Pisum sativum]
MQPLKTIPPKFDWVKPQQATIPVDKRCYGAESNPSVSCTLTSPLQVSPPPAKADAHFVSVGGDYKNLQPGVAKEPIVVMQQPQTVNAKQIPAASMSSSPPGISASWYPSNNVETIEHREDGDATQGAFHSVMEDEKRRSRKRRLQVRWLIGEAFSLVPICTAYRIGLHSVPWT